MLIKNNKRIDFFRETGKTTIALGANKDGEVEIVVKDAGKHLVSSWQQPVISWLKKSML